MVTVMNALVCILLFSGLTLSSSAIDVQDESGSPTPAHLVVPAYSTLARINRVSGAVLIDVTVGTTGKVTDTVIVAGPELLRQNARQAASISRFKPRNAPASVRLIFFFHDYSDSDPKHNPDYVSPYLIEIYQ